MIDIKHNLSSAYYKVLMALIVLSPGCKVKDVVESPWISLVKKETLSGWTQNGSEELYTIQNGTIIGTTTKNTPRTFLTSTQVYGDFILEYEHLADPNLKSGIVIRSDIHPNLQDGKIYGYRIELDPSEPIQKGGIFDEGSSTWLYPLAASPSAQVTFNQDQWNHFRIEAVGDTIKTWINSIPTSYLIDEKTARGHITLYVQSSNPSDQSRASVKWKNIKMLTSSLPKYATSTSLTPISTKNALTKQEADQGWKMLWDGKSTNGWRGARLDEFPSQGWMIEDGVLSVLSSGGAESNAGGDIVTRELYGDFELKVDFKLTEGANSGIKYYVDTDLNKGPGSSIGLEYQILDDDKHPDAKLGNHEGSRTVASLYDLIQADPNKPIRSIGEWNTAHIKSSNNHVEHWLNGYKVLEYERKSDPYRALVSASKYKIWPNFGEALKGHILLQDHGDYVSFKNIKIKSIDKR